MENPMNQWRVSGEWWDPKRGQQICPFFGIAEVTTSSTLDCQKLCGLRSHWHQAKRVDPWGFQVISGDVSAEKWHGSQVMFLQIFDRPLNKKAYQVFWDWLEVPMFGANLDYKGRIQREALKITFWLTGWSKLIQELTFFQGVEATNLLFNSF